VAVKTALNAKNLEALGAERLAELLIEISTGNAAAKRRLRLELAGAQSPAELAKEVRSGLRRLPDRGLSSTGKASDRWLMTLRRSGAPSSRRWPE
jgi:hypothetical protein